MSLPVACHYCRSTKYPMMQFVTRTGERILLCADGNACMRRKMRRDGIRLIPASGKDKP